MNDSPIILEKQNDFGKTMKEEIKDKEFMLGVDSSAENINETLHKFKDDALSASNTPDNSVVASLLPTS